MATVLFRVLKEDGYHVTVNTTAQGRSILKHDPHIDVFVEYVHGAIAGEDLEKYWDKLSKKYDRFINLSESIEGTLLLAEGRPEYYLSKEKRHRACNINYYDNTLAVGGYGDIKGRNAELVFSKKEEARARAYKRKYRDKFLVVWALSGSAYHKIYPYGEIVARLFVDTHPDAMIVTIGGVLETVGKWGKHSRIKYYANRWTLRRSLVMTKYANLVVSPETCIAVAAGCFNVPKVILLSHASKENLTKYWKNCETVYSNKGDCHPCHQLHETLDTCRLDPLLMTPVCMVNISPADVLNAMQVSYDKWEKKKEG